MNKNICSFCGQECKGKVTFWKPSEEDSVLIICENCLQSIGKCKTCAHGADCKFFNDIDPTPKFIMIQTREQTPIGYSIHSRQVPNTERLRKFCLDGKCKCCNDENPKEPYCCKIGGEGTCANYSEKLIFSKNSDIINI